MIDRHASVDPVHSIEILREDIQPALSMSKMAIAETLGISRQTLYNVLNEKQPVTARWRCASASCSATARVSGSTCNAVTI